MDISYRRRRRPTASLLECALARLMPRRRLPADPIARLDVVPDVDVDLRPA